jgi:DNA repair protein RecN (Recombination protein N)
MISSLYLKSFLFFDDINLEFENGLIVFTGSSGAGKSMLMDTFLSIFAYKDGLCSLGEVVFSNSSVKNSDFDISLGDDIVFKQIKKDKIRYLLNNQTISKKNLSYFCSDIIKHLHLRNMSDFNSSNLINSLDKICQLEFKDEFTDIKNSFENSFNSYLDICKKLNELEENSKKLDDLKEFTKYEIEKISSIDPKEQEYEELGILKKRLSKKDKIEQNIQNALGIFEYRSKVSKALESLDKDGTFFDDSMDELDNIFQSFNDSLEDLAQLDIEYILNRIEKLSSLQKKFGTIKNALDYKQSKIKELESYENISFEMSSLKKQKSTLESKLELLTTKLTTKREIACNILEKKINYYLKFLYLNDCQIRLKSKDLSLNGSDDVQFILNGVSLDTISSGEFNRLRLALLASISFFDISDGGVLFLDEIDANLSGKESKSVAVVLQMLAKDYQIFAISHQPQLTKSANQHFLVEKKEGISKVKLLNHTQRVDEIARIISGEEISQEALIFAKQLMSE